MNHKIKQLSIFDTKTYETNPLHVKEIIEIREYHTNGVLAYEANRAILKPEYAYLYINRYTGYKGFDYIYVGDMRKYSNTGSYQWELLYNGVGVVDKKGRPQKRADGSIIEASWNK